MNVETGHMARFTEGQIPAGYVPIPDDSGLQERLRYFNRAQRRRYAKLVRRGTDMRSAINQVVL